MDKIQKENTAEKFGQNKIENTYGSTYLSCRVICDVFRSAEQTMILVKDNSGCNIVMRAQIQVLK